MVTRGMTSRMATVMGFMAVRSLGALLWPVWATATQKPTVASAGRERDVNTQPEPAGKDQEIEKLKGEVRQLLESQKAQMRYIKAIETHLTFAPGAPAED